jgi:hypothetical protein
MGCLCPLNNGLAWLHCGPFCKSSTPFIFSGGWYCGEVMAKISIMLVVRFFEIIYI